PAGTAARVETVSAKAAKDTAPVRPKSALDRILATCPTAEDDVTDALTTTVVDTRIEKYRRLVRRCPNSGDLWAWLAQDYQTAGRRGEARQAAERALLLDGENKEAAQVMRELKSTPES
ncbi:MAG: hypothetical protein KDD44_10660, partial [Bdellovibrionales bacterium]|nr:hypothetical protein [Bdellovibrionales bacterium]